MVEMAAEEKLLLGLAVFVVLIVVVIASVAMMVVERQHILFL